MYSFFIISCEDCGDDKPFYMDFYSSASKITLQNVHATKEQKKFFDFVVVLLSQMVIMMMIVKDLCKW